MHSPFPAHHSAADDNSLIGCTSQDLTDDWSLASTHFVDSQYEFRVLFWVRSFIEPDLFDHNVAFDNTTPIYLINLLWKSGLGLGLDLKMHHFSIFTVNEENEHLFLREFRGR